MTQTWKEFQPASSLPPFVDQPLSITDFVRYQGASGDMNPIHHDQGFAEAAGFPSPFAVGMLQAGVLAAYLGEWLGPENIRRFKVQFREQAWPGDVLTYHAKVVSTQYTKDERVVELATRVTRQTGSDHIIGSATYAIP